MARIRTIKPSFFRHSALFDAERASGLPLRLAFAGLWTCADREGRFPWRSRELKLDCLPFDDVDFDAVLNALMKYGFIVSYQIDDEVYGHIPTWSKHQYVNAREPASTIPDPCDARARTCMHHTELVHARVEGEREGEGKKESKRLVSLTRNPDAHGTRLPADWRPNDDERTYAVERGLDPDRTAENFREWWCAQAGQRARKADWGLTWRTWCRREADRTRSDRSRSGGVMAAAVRAVARLEGQNDVPR